MLSSGLLLLLSIAYTDLPIPAATLNASGYSWVMATALAVQIKAERGLLPTPAVAYHRGEPFVVAVVNMDPEGKVRAEVGTALAFLRMRDAARQDGVRLEIVSGFRTPEQQRELFRMYRRGRGHLAARPGSSPHQSGHALDLDMSLPGVKQWLRSHARRFGFRRTVSGEPWHWEHW
jgi:hypothetical protein